MNRRSSNSVRIVFGLALALAVTVPAAVLAGPGAEDRETNVYVVAGDPDIRWTSAGHDLGSTWLGVQVVEETTGDEGGARVTRVVDDSPADRAGVRDGDVIVEFDGRVVRGPGALTGRVRSSEPGQVVSVVVDRNGERLTLDAELAEQSARWHVALPDLEGLDTREPLAPMDEEAMEQFHRQLEAIEPRLQDLKLHRFDVAPAPDVDLDHLYFDFSSRPTLGVQLAETTPELREHLGGDRDAGVLVTQVMTGMPAEAADVRVGDLISAVDGKPVRTVADLRHVLREREGETFGVTVIRDGAAVQLDVSLSEADESGPTGPRAVAPHRPADPAPIAPPRILSI